MGDINLSSDVIDGYLNGEIKESKLSDLLRKSTNKYRYVGEL